MPLLLFLLWTQEFEAEAGSEALADQLQALRDNPVSLNRAKKGDLTQIYWISPELAESIIKIRTENKGFKKIEELKEVPGMTAQIFENIEPYIRCSPIPAEKPAYSISLRQRLQKTLPEEENLIGTPEKVYQRLKLKYKNTSGVILLEKDPYEQSYSDFLTYGLMIGGANGRSPLHKIALGDYVLDFAEGLLFGVPPLITFKNQGVIKGKSKGIKPYTLSGENTFLRGVAMETSLIPRLVGVIFYSNANLDAKVDSEEITIYYNYEGDHSTELGLSKKDRVKEELFGTRIEYDSNIKLGGTWYRNSHFLNPEGDKVGSHNLFGIDFSTLWYGAEWFGEIGKCDTSWAGILGIEYRTKELKLGTLYRHYPAVFYIFHSAPWSARTATTGGLAERGNYLYGGYKFSNNTLLNCYFDYFTRLPKTSGELSTQSFELSGELKHKFTKEIIGIAKYSSQKSNSTERTRFRLQTDIGIKNIDFRIRTERAYEIDTETRSGQLWYGDFKFSRGTARRASTSAAVRIIFFDSEVRIYEYETDLPGLMTNRCLSGEGMRAYLYLKQRIAPIFTISLKYELTSKVDSELQKYGAQLDLIL